MILPEKKTSAADVTNREVCDKNGWKVGDRLILDPNGVRVEITAVGLWHVLVAMLDLETDAPMPSGEMEMNLWIDGWRKIDPANPKLLYQMIVNGKESWASLGEAGHLYATCLARVEMGDLVRNEDLPWKRNTRSMTAEERQKISDLADKISDNK